MNFGAKCMDISFENTETAFKYKSDRELRLAKFLFKTMNIPWLVSLGTKLTPFIIKSGLPVKNIIRKTIFKQFVGGETLEETSKVVDTVSNYNVEVILDYGAEGKDGEENFEKATSQFIKVINYAATQPHIPYISVKLTAFSRFTLLEKLNEVLTEREVLHGLINTDTLTQSEKEEWKKVVDRMQRICRAAAASNTSVMIDAEESWLQAPVDALTIAMMEVYNLEKPVVYNTIQLYRIDRLAFLKASAAAAKDRYLPAFKIVRGAYMEKERARAEEHNYPSPIQPDKAHTDRDYNSAIDFCLRHIHQLAVVIASHNEESNLYATELINELSIAMDHEHVHFSQLYGMSDNITFNLAKAGCSVSKYLPFGPIKDVIPYLMRRAQENSSVKGQTGRQLSLINKELERRKKSN
ncbi:proline dehydrogenase family protein [soil metagenome]